MTAAGCITVWCEAFFLFDFAIDLHPGDRIEGSARVIDPAWSARYAGTDLPVTAWSLEIFTLTGSGFHRLTGRIATIEAITVAEEVRVDGLDRVRCPVPGSARQVRVLSTGATHVLAARIFAADRGAGLEGYLLHLEDAAVGDEEVPAVDFAVVHPDGESTPPPFPHRVPPLLEPTEVARAVRERIAKETGRVDDPHWIPEDAAGWSARVPGAASPAQPVGEPRYDPETWRWFELVDCALVAGDVVVVFRWTDPATPELTYVVHASSDPEGASGTASRVVGSLRSLLRPGWRSIVEVTWLDRDRVLIRSPRRRRRESVERVLADLEAQRWTDPRASP